MTVVCNPVTIRSKITVSEFDVISQRIRDGRTLNQDQLMTAIGTVEFMSELIKHVEITSYKNELDDSITFDFKLNVVSPVDMKIHTDSMNTAREAPKWTRI